MDSPYQRICKLNPDSLKRKKEGEYSEVQSIYLNPYTNKELKIKLKIYPNPKSTETYTKISIAIKLTQHSNPNIKRIYIDFQFNVNKIKYTKQNIEFKRNDKTHKIFTEKQFEFIRKDQIDALYQFELAITLHSNDIKYFRTKRPSITAISYSQIPSNKSNNYNSEITPKIGKRKSEQNIDDKRLYLESKQEINALKQDRNELRQKNMKFKLKLCDYKQEIKALKNKNERFRMTLYGLRELACDLPKADLTKIDWAKGSAYNNFTQRSVALDAIVQCKQSEHKYKEAIKKGEFIIENNPNNPDCVYHKTEMSDINEYFEHNREGNTAPWIDGLRSNEIIQKQPIKECPWQTQLIGQNGCIALCDIANNTILGQYCGREMLKNEFYEIYNGTMEEYHHFTYLHGDTLTVPISYLPNANNSEPLKKRRKLNRNKCETKSVEIFIDAAAKSESPLIYINDGRAQFEESEVMSSDECLDRINCEFISCLVNGHIAILVRTIKNIKKNESLWINYGPYFQGVVEILQNIRDQKNKFQTRVRNIFLPIHKELGENRFTIE